MSNVENKLDEITEKLHNIDKHLERNTVSLEHHILRTKIAEENLELLRKDVRVIENHVHQVGGAVKFISIVSVILAIVGAIVKLI